MYEIPWRCKACHQEQMVDMENLERWPLDKLIIAVGYTCKNCSSREVISYSTASLEEAVRHLEQMRRTHRKFPFYFAKTVRKAEGINRRSKHGPS